MVLQRERQSQTRRPPMTRPRTLRAVFFPFLKANLPSALGCAGRPSASQHSPWILPRHRASPQPGMHPSIDILVAGRDSSCNLLARVDWQTFTPPDTSVAEFWLLWCPIICAGLSQNPVP
jgi:hypothetical protein